MTEVTYPEPIAEDNNATSNHGATSNNNNMRGSSSSSSNSNFDNNVGTSANNNSSSAVKVDVFSELQDIASWALAETSMFCRCEILYSILLFDVNRLDICHPGMTRWVTHVFDRQLSPWGG